MSFGQRGRGGGRDRDRDREIVRETRERERERERLCVLHLASRTSYEIITSDKKLYHKDT